MYSPPAMSLINTNTKTKIITTRVAKWSTPSVNLPKNPPTLYFLKKPNPNIINRIKAKINKYCLSTSTTIIKIVRNIIDNASDKSAIVASVFQLQNHAYQDHVILVQLTQQM